MNSPFAHVLGMNSSFNPVDRIVFLGHCPDRSGLVKQISQFFAAKGANLTNLQQHTERDRFFIRLEGEWHWASTILPPLD
ncbi:MAG: ACT domain-containing protein [Magnetococcales bacterium]|nr:ACT domain-containing protein [Magnetococcales bacterium]